MKSLLLLLLSVHMTIAIFQLRRLSWMKLPKNADINNPSYELFSGSAEESTFDPMTNLIYVVGDITNVLHIIDIHTPAQPRVIYSQSFDVNNEGQVLDIEVCGDKLAVAFSGRYEASDGHVIVYNTFKPGDTGLVSVYLKQAVGVYPDNLKFTPDCKVLVVANEGRPGYDGASTDSQTKFLDPEGTITLIDMHLSNPSLTNIGFQDYNDQDSIEYFTATEHGRYAWKGNHSDPDLVNHLSQDLEPEYVTITDDGQYAFVSIQENNAIAKIDITQKRLLWLKGLGFKDWSQLDIDASDFDDAVLRRKYNIRSFYMPDAIKYVILDQKGYILSLDEGSHRSLQHGNILWQDSERAFDILNTDHGIDVTNINSEVLASINNLKELGRLYIGREDGYSYLTQLIETVYHFGGRGWSMWEDRDLQQVVKTYDSGGDIEQILQMSYPGVFNSKATRRNSRPTDEMDIRSPVSGPELNGIAFGKGRNNAGHEQDVLFVGDQNSNAIFGYTFSLDRPVFQKVQRFGLTDASWQNLYNNGEQIGDAGISEMGFIPQPQSPSLSALVYVLGAESGSLAIYEVIDI